MSIQFTANNQIFKVNSTNTLTRAFTLLAKVKLDDTAVAGTVLSLFSPNSKIYRLRWSGVTWELINNDGTLITVGGTATTSEWVSVALRVTTFNNGIGDITRVAAFVRNTSGATVTASGDTVQYTDTIGQIFVGNYIDYSAAGRNNARFKAADVKSWSVVLSQADIEAEWNQQAPIRTADRVVVNYLDGGSIAAAQTSDYAVATWANSWTAVDADGTTKSLPVYSAEAPSYTTNPTLSGEDTLPQLDNPGTGGALERTLGAATLSSTGEVPRTGALSSTLGVATLSSTGTVPVRGELSRTLGAATLTSAGAVRISGALSSTLGAATLTAADASLAIANLSATLGAVTFSSTGVAILGEIDGTLIGLLGPASLSSGGFVGTVPVERAFTATVVDNTFVATALATDFSRTARAVELQATVVQ